MIKDLTLITYFAPLMQQGLFGGIGLPKRFAANWFPVPSRNRLEGKRADGPMAVTEL
jgi:hypothetical protein